MVIKCHDFTEGYFELNKALFFGDKYDHERGGVTAHKFGVIMVAQSPDCELNLHDFNYTMNKWKMLNNLYLDQDELGVFVARLLHYLEDSKTFKYIPDIAMQFKRRRNVSGACLLNMSLGFNRGKWRCTVMSRASELTCRWPIDLIFVHVLLKTVCEYLKINFHAVEVTWHMVSTYQSITSIPYFLVLAGEEQWIIDAMNKDPDELSDWQQYTVKRYIKCYRGDSYTSYRVQRRPMEAYRMLKGEMPRKQILWTENLTLQLVEFDGSLEEDFDEVDVLNIDMETLERLEAEAIENDLFGKGGYR